MVPSTDPLELLRDHGLRATSQRIEILRTVVDGEGHPTAEDVWERAREAHPTLSLSTGYDTLSRFVELGVLGELHAGEGAVRYEFFEEPHVNLVCTECGSVADADSEAIAALLAEAGRVSTFEIPPQPVELRGRCRDCHR